MPTILGKRQRSRPFSIPAPVILYGENRVALMLGSSVGNFQIPNRNGLQPSLGLTVNGVTTYRSQSLDENQREVTQFGVLSWQHSSAALDVETSVIARYSSLTFKPDLEGALLFTGIAQNAGMESQFGWTKIAMPLPTFCTTFPDKPMPPAVAWLPYALACPKPVLIEPPG